MLAYAAQTRTTARRGSPKALALIFAAHVLAISAAMSAKMEIVSGTGLDPTTIFNVPIAPPPEPPQQPETKPQPRRSATQQSFIDDPATIVDMDATSPATSLDQGATIDDIASVIGSDIALTRIDPPAPVRVAARFNTPENALRPPYPNDKLRDQEEAVLKLRLNIDARGRVTTVEPVGPADPSFLAAARRHIVQAWRYKPATEDGVAVPSSTVITLAFRLEDV